MIKEKRGQNEESEGYNFLTCSGIWRGIWFVLTGGSKAYKKIAFDRAKISNQMLCMPAMQIVVQ